MKALILFLALLAAIIATPASAQAPSRCTGKFVNPVTDIC